MVEDEGVSTALEVEARTELVACTADEDVWEEMGDEEEEAVEDDEVLFSQLRTADSSDMLPLGEKGLQTSWQDAALRVEGT